MKKICDFWKNRDILYFTTTLLILLQNLITSPLGPFVPASCCITASDHSTLYYHNQIKARRSKKEMTPVFTESNPDMLGTTTIPIASLQLLFTFLLSHSFRLSRLCACTYLKYKIKLGCWTSVCFKSSCPQNLETQTIRKIHNTKPSFSIHTCTMQATVTIETGHSGHIEDLLKSLPGSIIPSTPWEQSCRPLPHCRSRRHTTAQRLTTLRSFSIRPACPFCCHPCCDANDRLEANRSTSMAVLSL